MQSKRLSWRRVLVGSALVVCGMVHVAPGVALVVPARLTGLYGLQPLDPTQVVLLRYRALLLALVGVALLGAVAKPELRRPALAAALLSNAVFIGLVASTDTSPEVVRVAVVDGVLVPLLVGALVVDGRDGADRVGLGGTR